ncbi:MAG TPA: carotenoid oxygenase family protein [Desulfuromonadaceae bacterium]
MNRREFLGLAATAGGTLLTAGCAGSPPLRLDAELTADLGRLPYHGLVESLPEERDYEAGVEGRIPPELRGSLYRNGPGLFERNGLRKRSLLDGDGMIQQFRFHDKGVHYRTRFVRTAKFRAESAAGRFLYPTWSTLAPGGWLANFWMTDAIKGQAGVTVYLVNGRLYAFDESSYPYELDPATLETIGETSLGIPRSETIYSAHSKIDPATGEWLHFGVRYGATPTLHISVFRADGRPRYHRAIPLPRLVYIHDWFVSTTHLIANLHPMEIDFWPALFGFRSISDSLRWRPEKGNQLLVIPRDPTGSPVTLEAPACFMWHSLNAWDDGREITADFVGYTNPDHLVGRDPIISAVMEGRTGSHTCPGLLRRYRIDLPGRRVRQEVLAEGRSFEWPRMDERLRCRPYRLGWLAETHPGDFFWKRVTGFDVTSGAMEHYDFGPDIYCSEPVFVPRPGGGHDEGWVLSECYDGGSNRSFLAVLDSLRLAWGPLALVRLSHHVPFSYHGWWQAGE